MLKSIFLFNRRSFGFAILATLLCGGCEAGQSWDTASISFRNNIHSFPTSAILQPDLPKPEDQDLEEDPDSLPPHPS